MSASMCVCDGPPNCVLCALFVFAVERVESNRKILKSNTRRVSLLSAMHVRVSFECGVEREHEHRPQRAVLRTQCARAYSESIESDVENRRRTVNKRNDYTK